MSRSALLVALLLVAASASAQAPPEPVETVRLLILHPELRSTMPATGRFDGLGPDSLYLTGAAYPRDLVVRLEVARGTTSYGLVGAGLGALVGATVGLALGAAADHRDIPQEGEPRRWPTVTLVGAGVGFGLGGMLGSAFKRTRWEPVVLGGTASAGLRWRLPLGAPRRSVP